jgi:hypothetical protein
LVAPDASFSHSPAFELRHREAREEDRRELINERLKAIRGADGKGTSPPSISAVSSQRLTTAGHVNGGWWREQQLKDAKIKAIIDFKEGKQLDLSIKELLNIAAQADGMKMTLGKEGELYHLWTPGDKRPNGDTVRQVVVPDVDGLRKEKFLLFHAEAGHMRAGKTFERMRDEIYYDEMWADCERWSDECLICAQTTKMASKTGLLDPTTTAKLKGKRRIHMDILGPLKKSEDGEEYIIVAIDLDDGWPEAQALKGTTSPEVIKAFKETVVATSGVPDELVTDAASNFTSEHAEAVFKDLGIEKKETTAYNPMADGPAEALVKITTRTLKKMTKELKEDWKAALPVVMMVLRSSFKEPQKISPFEARFGRKMKLPSSFAMPEREIESRSEKEMKEMKEKIERLRDEAAAKSKVTFDKGRQEADLKAGDMVWMRKHVKDHKLDDEKDGPFEVEQVMSPLNVKLKEVVGGPELGRRKRVVNVKHVEKFKAKEVPGAVEHVVADVIGHEGRAGSRKYIVIWQDGSVTREKKSNLVDKEGDEEIPNEALLAYWERNPRLSRV